MKLLEDRIKLNGKVLPGNVLKVDSFLNNQIDVALLVEMGKEIYNHFKDCSVNKIVTIESSGIGLACITAQFFNCKVVFARKSKSSNMSNEVYSSTAYSYTHKTTNNVIISKEYLTERDNVLLIDDFLANGEATKALIDLLNQAGATLKGVAIAVEKGFQGGGDKLRKQGVDLLSLAIVDKMDENGITFRS